MQNELNILGQKEAEKRPSQNKNGRIFWYQYRSLVLCLVAILAVWLLVWYVATRDIRDVKIWVVSCAKDNSGNYHQDLSRKKLFELNNPVADVLMTNPFSQDFNEVGPVYYSDANNPTMIVYTNVDSKKIAPGTFFIIAWKKVPLDNADKVALKKRELEYIYMMGDKNDRIHFRKKIVF
jgi:hypothetical protein